MKTVDENGGGQPRACTNYPARDIHDNPDHCPLFSEYPFLLVFSVRRNNEGVRRVSAGISMVKRTARMLQSTHQ